MTLFYISLMQMPPLHYTTLFYGRKFLFVDVLIVRFLPVLGSVIVTDIGPDLSSSCSEAAAAGDDDVPLSTTRAPLWVLMGVLPNRVGEPIRAALALVSLTPDTGMPNCCPTGCPMG